MSFLLPHCRVLALPALAWPMRPMRFFSRPSGGAVTAIDPVAGISLRPSGGGLFYIDSADDFSLPMGGVVLVIGHVDGFPSALGQWLGSADGFSLPSGGAIPVIDLVDVFFTPSPSGDFILVSGSAGIAEFASDGSSTQMALPARLWQDVFNPSILFGTLEAGPQSYLPR